MSEILVNDWEQIQKCFTSLKNVSLDPKSDNRWVFTIEGQKRTFAKPVTRDDLITLAAFIMRPRQDTKRLREQINFVCFGVV